MKLVVIIPCLNEEKTIGKVIKGIPNSLKNITKTEVIVIDDGSTDKSVEIAQKLNAIVFSHGTRQGVGYSIYHGINEALKRKPDIIVNMDGDGQFNPKDISKLVYPIINDKAEFVTASRFIDKLKTPKMPIVKLWGNKLVSKIVSLLTRQKFYDVSCGFRAYSKDTALKLNLFGKFTYTQESFLDLAFKNVRIVEIPMQIYPREHGKSKVAASIIRYAIQASKIIIRGYKDYKPLRFFGGLSLFFFILSIILGGYFFFISFFITKLFRGNLWAALLSAFLFFVSFGLGVIGLIADMLGRIRENQEKLLYFSKKQEYYGDDKKK